MRGKPGSALGRQVRPTQGLSRGGKNPAGRHVRRPRAMGGIKRFSPRLKVGLALVFLAGFNTAAYWPSLRAPFLFDDYFNILENPDIWRVGMGYAPLYKLAWARWPSR